MRRVLIVSPYFAPVNGADSHRVRATAPFFTDYGWSAEVLAVEPACLAAPRDPWLLDGIPATVPIHRAGALSLRWSFIPGLGTIDLRARRSLRRLGRALLQSRNFDLVYFSTTSFGLTTLGPYWKRRLGVPFIIDYQDPWFSDYYRRHPAVQPPGGRLKYAVADRLGRWQEPRALKACAAITAVSPAYPQQLRKRYPFMQRVPHLTIPFPAAARDFQRLPQHPAFQNFFDPHDGHCHWVSVGVSGPLMFRTLTAFFGMLAAVRRSDPQQLSRLKLHFIGTSYAPTGTAHPAVLPLAAAHGLADLVHEVTDRVAYSTALGCLRDAHALLAFGTDDVTYNASKLLPYVLAEKPLLAVFHEGSPATRLLRQVGGATLITFEADLDSAALAARIRAAWWNSNRYQQRTPISAADLALYTDREQAGQLTRFFDAVLSGTWTSRSDTSGRSNSAEHSLEHGL